MGIMLLALVQAPNVITSFHQLLEQTHEWGCWLAEGPCMHAPVVPTQPWAEEDSAVHPAGPGCLLR